MNVQVIKRDGEPEYAVLPWADYQALLQAAAGSRPRQGEASSAVVSPLGQVTRLRQDKGMSVEELARAVGVSPHYLGMIERGERQPDAAILRALAWTLGVAGWESAS